MNNDTYWKQYDFHPDKVDELFDRFSSKGYTGLNIKANLINEDSIRVIERVPNVEHLYLESCNKKINIDFCKNFKNLKNLLVDGSCKIDFSWFPSLTKLRIEYTSGMFLNPELAKLKHLGLMGYREENITSLSSFIDLEYIEITNSSISDLVGINRLKNLQELDFHNLRELKGLNGLSNPSLLKVSITNAKKMTDYAPIEGAHNLEKLSIENCGPAASLAFIYKLKRLNSVRFMNTDVIDGDLSLLVGIKKVRITNKKHFSHKMSDFPDSI